jgi:ABC-2 type transport system ATP-binding protein
MALTATHLIVVGQGRLIADSSVEELTSASSRESVLVRTEEAARLRDLLVADGVSVSAGDLTELEVTGLSSAAIGRIAMQAGIPLVELTPKRASLEEAFMSITRDSVEFDAPLNVPLEVSR